MEDIKDNFDKMFDQYSNSSQNNGKSGDFDVLNESMVEPTPKKRKLSTGNGSFGEVSIISEETMRELTNLTASFDKTNYEDVYSSDVIVKSWQIRRLKCDLLSAEAKVVTVMREVELLNKVKGDMEIQFEHKVSSLEKELDTSKTKVEDLERHLRQLRSTEKKYRTLAKTQQSEFDVAKQELEDRVYSLERENEELRSSARSVENELNNEISDLNRQLVEVEAQYDTVMRDCDELKEWKAEVEEKLATFESMTAELTSSKASLVVAQTKVDELQFELEKHGELQELLKINKEKHDKYYEFERENEKLKKKNKELHELIKGKLLMEEQIFDLKEKLKNSEREHQELVDLKHKMVSVTADLEQWEEMAYHFLPASEEKPSIAELKRKFDEILQKDLTILDESASAKSEKAQLITRNDEFKTENELLKKQTEDIQRSLKHHQSILYRLQKKLQLIARERDAYKQLLDSYEKDLTISATSASNQEPSLRLKVETLEKSVAGYRELCAKMEQELQEAKANPDFTTGSLLTSTQYESLKNEAQQLRSENESLRRRRDELELETQTKKLRESVYGTVAPSAKVLHFENNPASVAHKLQTIQVEKLQAEIEILRSKCKKLEAGNLELTMQLQDQSMVAHNIKEKQELKDKIVSLENKNYHLRETYKYMSQEFREVCYMLFGYRVDRVAKAQYRISSMYAEGAEDFLNFRLNDEGALDMLETEYSETLAEMMKTHLQNHNSLPAFLSSLTLDLFNRTTICL